MEKKYTLADYNEIGREMACFTCTLDEIPKDLVENFHEISDYLIAHPDVIMDDEKVKTHGYTKEEMVRSIQHLKDTRLDPSGSACSYFVGVGY